MPEAETIARSGSPVLPSKMPLSASFYARDGRLAQLVRAPALQAGGPRFESVTAHHFHPKNRQKMSALAPRKSFTAQVVTDVITALARYYITITEAPVWSCYVQRCRTGGERRL